MKVAVLGLGIQGNKRVAIAGTDVAITVDPVNPAATHKAIEEVPLESFECALVCTPDGPKLGLLEYLLAHGKHVLVEKPLLAQDETQLSRLHQVANSAGVACYTAYNHRFEPHFVKMKELISSGTLGEIYSCRMFYGNGTAKLDRLSFR